MPPPDLETLTLYDITDPPTLDPARSWAVLDGRLVGLIFSNLVRFDHEAHIQPDLASDWIVSQDGLQYTFHLKPEARFSTGRPVTAEEVRYSFERVLDPKTASSSRWVLERIKKIEVLDPHTIILRLNEPFAPFLQLLAMPAASIVPQEEVERCEREGVPFGERPVGSGPWLFKRWQHDQQVDFERNETYWGAKPHLRRLQVRILGNPFSAIAEFETGNVGVIDPLPEAEILRWKTHPQWKTFTRLTPLLTTDMMVFNCERPPLDRVETRQALCQAVEAPLVLDCVRQGAGVTSTGPIPPGLDGYTHNRTPFSYDPKTARTVLMNAGMAEKEITLLIPVHEGYVRTTAEVIQAEWKKVGVRARIHQAEWVTYRQRIRTGEFDVAFRSWYADYPDGDSFLFPLFHSSQVGAGNVSRFRDAEIDALMERSQREMDSERRRELLVRANDLIYEKAPALFLWYRAAYSVHQPWLQGFSVPLIFNGTRYLEERIEKPQG